MVDLEVVIDHGWILTFALKASVAPQLGIASEGGSGRAALDLSIEVSDVDHVYQRAAKTVAEIPYENTDEAWGVGRSFVRDPFAGN